MLLTCRVFRLQSFEPSSSAYPHIIPVDTDATLPETPADAGPSGKVPPAGEDGHHPKELTSQGSAVPSISETIPLADGEPPEPVPAEETPLFEGG